MTDASQNPPDLESRFLPPTGWRFGSFTNANGKYLRFGTVSPAGGKPDAVIVVLQGLSEFIEKYYEVAHSLLARNCAFWMMDWQAQGKSERHPPNPERRHSVGFDEDVSDLHQMIAEYVLPQAGDVSMVMLAHSMGGNVGLRYLSEHPEVFKAAAFSAPMVGIRAVRRLPDWLSLSLTTLLQKAMRYKYIFGGSDWHANLRDPTIEDMLTRDPVRNKIHNAWCLHDPALQVGNATFGWLHEAVLSCAKLARPGVAASIKIPTVFGLAGHEHLVDNLAIRAFAARMPNSILLTLGDSYHEILMERDFIRDSFLTAFDALLEKTL